MTPLDTAPGSYAGRVRLSPDGTRLAVLRQALAQHGRWIVDLARGVPSKLTPRGDVQFFAWTRDGAHLVFQWLDNGTYQFAIQRADGAGSPERLSDGFEPGSITADDREVIA